MEMTKRERIRAAVSGEKPDRIPFGMWSHMPQVDHDADANTEATWQFYRDYDLDFIKTMNSGMYSIEDYGCEIDYSDVPKGGIAKLTATSVRTREDWGRIGSPDIRLGAMGRELRYLDNILKKSRAEDVPVLFTVFSPVTTANKLCGGHIASWIHGGHEQEVKEALGLITETTEELAREAVRRGADGVFLATQMSTYAAGELLKEALTEEEFAEYGKPYDCRVLEAARGEGAWLNTLHCHGEDIMFDVLKDYPCDVFNYHMWETLPSPEEALLFTGKCLMGGLKRFDITRCRRNEIRHQIFRCCQISGGKNLILTPGCVVRWPLDPGMLHYIRKTKEEAETAMLL